MSVGRVVALVAAALLSASASLAASPLALGGDPRSLGGGGALLSYIGINFDTTGDNASACLPNTNTGSPVAACGTVGDTSSLAISPTGYLLPSGSRPAFVRSLRCLVLSATGFGAGDSVAVQPYHRNGTNASYLMPGITIPVTVTSVSYYEAAVNQATTISGGVIALRVSATDANASITDLDLFCSLLIAP